MAADSARAKSLFLAASELADAGERAAFLDRECGGDAELRARVEALLKADDAALSRPRATPLLRPAIPARQTSPMSLALTSAKLSPAATSCWRRSARAAWAPSSWPMQTEPVRRTVAVKIIKPGMDSKAVLARFEAERQALAMMDHPNIARVLDAGSTDTGPALLRHGTGQGHADHQVLRPAPAHAAAAAGTLRAGLPGDPARPPEGGHPPRHQADQRAGGHVRRPPGAQGDRLRPGQGGRAAADGEDAHHRVRRVGGHAGVHVAGAGQPEQSGHRHPQRRLFAGRAAVRAADGHARRWTASRWARRRSWKSCGSFGKWMPRGRARS